MLNYQRVLWKIYWIYWDTLGCLSTMNLKNLNVGLTTSSTSATSGPGLAHSSTLHEAIKPLRRKSRRHASGNQGWHRGTQQKSLFFTWEVKMGVSENGVYPPNTSKRNSNEENLWIKSWTVAIFKPKWSRGMIPQPCYCHRQLFHLLASCQWCPSRPIHHPDYAPFPKSGDSWFLQMCQMSKPSIRFAKFKAPRNNSPGYHSKSRWGWLRRKFRNHFPSDWSGRCPWEKLTVAHRRHTGFCQYWAKFAKKLTPWHFMKSPWIYLAARVEHPMVTTCGHGQPLRGVAESPSPRPSAKGHLADPTSHHPIFGIN